MWPIWLLITIIAVGLVAFTVPIAIFAVSIDRKRQKKAMKSHIVDREVSQRQQAHISINDVDVAHLPKPTKSCRQSLQHVRRDSRFYSTMPSEEEIKSFPDRTTESLAQVSSGVKSPPAKAQRNKKLIKLSMSAPRPPQRLESVSESVEHERKGSPEPIELPAFTTPKVTPEKLPEQTLQYPYAQMTHQTGSSVESIPITFQQPTNRVSQRVDHGNAVKSRSISMGNVRVPPNCALPSLPPGAALPRQIGGSVVSSNTDVSVHHTGMSTLNSSLPSQQEYQVPASQPAQPSTFSGFNFDLNDGSVQVVRVEADSGQPTPQSEYVSPPFSVNGSRSSINTSRQPVSYHHTSGWSMTHVSSQLSAFTPTLSPSGSAVSRPLSMLSLDHPEQRSPLRTCHPDDVSRPASVSSVDCFRNSIVGNAAAAESPRSKGHKRQNCIRISRLTQVESKKRLSSQLDRLAEVEEVDNDNRSVGIEIPFISPAKPFSAVPIRIRNEASLIVPKLQIPKPPKQRVHLLAQQWQLQAKNENVKHSAQFSTPKNQRTENSQQSGLTRSKTMDGHFVYQGSPKSDPTKPPKSRAQYSPISPATAATTPSKSATLESNHSSNSSAMLEMNAQHVESTSPKRSMTYLHGPRNIPAPSLRIKNKTSPRIRHNDRSGSPIRKPSGPVHAKQIPNITQDDMKRSLALLKSLDHAAQSQSGLPEFNIIKKESGRRPSLPDEAQIVKTPSSKYQDTPPIDQPRALRQRSRTMGPRMPSAPSSTSLRPTQFREDGTSPKGDLNSSSSVISIWEDESVRDESPSTTRFQGGIRQIQPSNPSSPQVEKGSLWKLQQNADIITTRALAMGSDASKKDLKNSPRAFDGYRGARDEESTAKLGASMKGALSVEQDQSKTRQRSHTVASHAPSRDGDTYNRTREGVGLGVNFGRTGLANTFILNDMQRETIGKLR